ncbi:unnamed protein product, partial [Durusdinium trenchii]
SVQALNDHLAKIREFFSNHPWASSIKMGPFLDSLFADTSTLKLALEESTVDKVKQFIVEGEISSRVLQQDTALKTLQNTMLLLVLDTMEGMQDEEAEANMLEKACALYAELQKQLSSSAHLSSKAEWHGSAKKLLARLEQVIAYVGKGWAIRTWKQSGPEEIAPALANCKHLAPELQPVLSLAKNAPHLKNLVPVEVDKKDLNAVLKYVKKGLTVASMDTSVMGDFLPEEEVNKVVAYKDSVMKALEE